MLTYAALQDWRNCNKPAAEVTGYDDSIDEGNDDATYGFLSAITYTHPPTHPHIEHASIISPQHNPHTVQDSRASHEMCHHSAVSIVTTERNIVE
jgi:hypothetical protein